MLPIECFQRRTDANSRRTTCDECRKAYQRERYVRVGARVVTVEVAAHDACVGRPCPRCGEPFRPGQRVQGDDVHHESCPRRGSAKAGAPR
ncbi:MAG: hypothetical protein JO086_02180 [Acidimicrobiia bacterium]|nr:hypothetical protein [Acidimicrobiia bacterium]